MIRFLGIYDICKSSQTAGLVYRFFCFTAVSFVFLLFINSYSLAEVTPDNLFADDLYLPSIALAESLSWDIEEALQNAKRTEGMIEIDEKMLFKNKPTLQARPADGKNRSTISWLKPVEQGQYYSFSCFSRTVGREPGDQAEFLPMYGFLSLQWLDAEQRVIGVRDKLMSRPGSEGFWNIKQVKALSPPGAKQARLTITTGWHESRENLWMWFGDLRWEMVEPSPIKLTLYPRVLQSNNELLEIRVSRTHQASVTIDSKLDIELLDANKKVIRSWSSPNLITLPWIKRVKLPANCGSGYVIRVRIEPLKEHPGNIKWSISEPVLISNSQIEGRFKDGRFFFKGRKGLLIGAYHAKPEDYEILKKSGFNTVICKSYNANEAAQIFDSLEKLGLYGFASVGGGGQTRANQERVGSVVKALRNHPALLAWDLLDEPTRKGVGPREIAWYGCWTQFLAPQIPTFVNCCGPYTFDRFASTVDVFSVDPYPIYLWADYKAGLSDIGHVSQWLDLVKREIPTGRGYMGVVECFTFDKKNKPPATAKEVRNMVYQVLASGACGVIYYSVREAGWYLPDEPQFKEIAKINKEIVALENYFITEPLKREEQVLKFLTDRPDQLITATWKNGAKYLTVVINLARVTHKIGIESQDSMSMNVPKSLELGPLEVHKMEYLNNL